MVDLGEHRYNRRIVVEGARRSISRRSSISQKAGSYLGISVWLLRRGRLMVAIATLLWRWWSVVLRSEKDVSTVFECTESLESYGEW